MNTYQMKPSEFDNRCLGITQSLNRLSKWKHIYFGSAYTTRLQQLQSDLKKLVTFIEETIEEDLK